MQRYNKFHLDEQTLENECYRYILSSTKQMQIVLMSLLVSEEIPEEVHDDLTQFIYIVRGRARITIEGESYIYEDGDAVLIPPGNLHRVENVGMQILKLYTIYSLPHHKKNTC